MKPKEITGRDLLADLSSMTDKELSRPLVYASDEEGNSYHKVYNLPCFGLYDGDDFSGGFGNDEAEGEEVICIN